jgi:YVTN family beta-propeller protein
MKNLKLSTLLTTSALLTLITSSCHKDKKVTPTPTLVTSGFYVLNQGVFNDNNSTLTAYNYNTKTATTDFFSNINGRGLGDTGNDIEIYGSKMYIVVNVSSTIEIVDAKTAKSIKQISMVSNGTPREPRDVVFYGGKAYVSAYDGTVSVIDTTTLAITSTIAVGRDPEQLVVANGKIYVANSGGLDYPNYDNSVSVINPVTNTVTKTITVVENPQDVATDGKGNVYVLSAGDYNTVVSSLAVIDDNADVVKTQTNFDASVFIAQGSNAYFITNEGGVGSYNTGSQSIGSANFIADGTTITTPYALAADASTGEVFVMDSKDYTSDGEVFAFDKTGKKEYTVTTGINPGKIAFIKSN